MIDLDKLSDEQLSELVLNIRNELANREYALKLKLEVIKKQKDELADEYEFKFQSTRSNKIPFVAKVVYQNNNLERLFKQLDKTEGYGREVTVSGKFKAKEKEILDIRDDSGRAYYAVVNGELIKISDSNDSIEVDRLKQYLKGDIEFDTLYQLYYKDEREVEVLDELKD